MSTKSQATATAVLAAGDADGTKNRTIHGVAISDDEITNGLHGKKKWVPEELEQAAPTLRGETVTAAPDVGGLEVEGALMETNHGERVRVGQITNSAYEPGVGVVYELDVEDEDIYSALALGELDISIEASNPSDVDSDPDTGATVMRGYDFVGMDVVEKGAARSNHTAAGPASNNAAIAALSAQDVSEMLDEKSEQLADDESDETGNSGDNGTDVNESTVSDESAGNEADDAESSDQSDEEAEAEPDQDQDQDQEASAADTDDPSEGEVSADADDSDSESDSDSEESADTDAAASEDAGDDAEDVAEDDDPETESTSGPETDAESDDGNAGADAEADVEGEINENGGESGADADEDTQSESTMSDNTPEEDESTESENAAAEEETQSTDLNLDGQVVIDEERHDELKTKAALAEEYEEELEDTKRQLNKREEQIDTVHGVYSAALAEAGPHSEEFYSEMPLETLKNELRNTQGTEDDAAALEESVTSEQPLPQTGDQSADDGADEAALEAANEVAEGALRLDDTAALASSEQSAHEYVQDNFGVDSTEYDDDLELRDALYNDAATAGGDD